MSDFIPYEDWPEDSHSRWISAGNAFGEHLLSASLDYALDELPADADASTRAVAQAAARNAIYGMMMLLDGVATAKLGPDVRAEYVLLSRVRSRAGDILEQFELAPDEDGLCMGFHGWIESRKGSD